MIRPLLFVCTIAVSVPAASTRKLVAGVDLLGLSTRGFQLVEIDALGNTSPRGSSAFATGLDFTHDGSILYSVSSSLRTVNPQTGMATNIAPLTFGGTSALVSSMTMTPGGRMLVTDDSDGLFQVDLANGELSLLGRAGSPIWGIESTPDGRLFGAAFDLFELSPIDGSILQTIGSMDEFIIDLDYTAEGRLLGVSSSSANNALYELDYNTSGDVTTLIAEFVNDQVRSIASAHVVPEPSSILIWAGIGAGISLRRRQRTRKKGTGVFFNP